MGVVHALRPEKRFHWRAWSSQFNSRLLISSYSEIYRKIGDSQIVIRFYGKNTTDIAEHRVSWKEISVDNVNASLPIGDICSDERFKKDAFGYISVWSDYGGFLFLRLLQRISQYLLSIPSYFSSVK